MAAPSSPNCPTAGSAAWWAKNLSLANMAPSTRLVVGCSMERWNLQFRLAAVKCTRPSAVSALGLTVQELAVHMLEAELQAASSGMASFAAWAITSASVPAKPRLRRAATSWRSCGANTPCLKPISISAFILPRPCSAASFGLEAAWLLLCEATLP
ncbi:hypothetical protein D3C81_1559670 [compost metagenome]